MSSLQKTGIILLLQIYEGYKILQREQKRHSMIIASTQKKSVDSSFDIKRSESFCTWTSGKFDHQPQRSWATF